ncbi:MAG: alpha-mannosidase [Rubrobacteraceae bacterium]
MTSHDKRRLTRLASRVDELRLWRNAFEAPIEKWAFSAGNGKAHGAKLGDFWPEIALPVHLSAEVEIPASWAGLPVEVELSLGGEGFVRFSNGATGGLNPYHANFPAAGKARGGEVVGVEAEVVSKGLFGSHVAEPRIERAHLVVPECDVRAFERDLSMTVEVCAALGDHESMPLLLDAVDESLAALAPAWPTDSPSVVSRHFSRRQGRELWRVPEDLAPMRPLPEEARVAVVSARKLLASKIEEIRDEYPPVGRMLLTGHAHLDLAWLWPLEETRRKGRRTFASVLSLMDRYEDFTFNQSSAQLYEWIEADAPELFERVKERIEEGRWEAVGGSWTEPDCQIPSGESFVRQLFYGQKYFEEKFGRRSAVAWLPDAFGFSPGIPQLLRQAGITGFFTYKMNWSETNEFPHDLFIWEGLDGSSVVAHDFENPGQDYNGNIVPRDLLGTWRNFKGKRLHRESLFSFGWGDGGGGPSEEMLENYSRLKNFPAMPRLSMGRVDGFFASLPREGLPKWVGELYLELHRGTLTSQAKVKKLNRESEHRLLEAEAFATLASLRGFSYPAAELERMWKTLLLNQFHDILPGSSIHEVYEDAHRQLEEVVAKATEIRDESLRNLADENENTFTVANAGLNARPLTATLPEADSIVDAKGRALPTQKVEDGTLVHAPHHLVPGLGWTALKSRGGGRAEAPAEKAVMAEENGDGAVIENESLRVEVGDDGSLRRVFDKERDREALDGRANRLVAYVDKPREWEAWDVDEDYEKESEELPGAESVEVVEEGPLRASVRVVRRWRDSTIEQTYRLLASSRRLDIETYVDWRERRMLLRALFPLNVRSHETTFETMFGVARRPTHRNTSWDEVRFEVCAHRFCDLSEPGYGVALLNDGKYGHNAKDNVLGISFLRGPVYPDPFADEGEHRFTYSLFPHPGDWSEAGVVEEAFAMNSPLTVVSGSIPEAGFVEVSGTRLALGSLKLSEDGRGVILRLYEPHGARGEAALRFPSGVDRVERTNLLEEHEGPVEVEGDSVRLSVRPFEVVTLVVEEGMGDRN